MFKKKLTEVAVDQFTQYLQEKFERLKEFDLDQDGQKDVDQVIELLGRCATKAKATLDTTDFPTIASGLEHVLKGAAMIRNSIDQQQLAEFGEELAIASTKLTKLGHLTIAYVKDQGGKIDPQ
jgi:hypothetical protein